MRHGRRRGSYKFTEKSHSKKGMVALGLAGASVAIFIFVVYHSFLSKGNGNMYLGSAGVASLLLGIVSAILAVKSLKEENSFRLFPYLATACSFLITGVWIALYVAGSM